MATDYCAEDDLYLLVAKFWLSLNQAWCEREVIFYLVFIYDKWRSNSSFLMHKIDIGSAKLCQIIAPLQIFHGSNLVSKLQPLQAIVNYGAFSY